MLLIDVIAYFKNQLFIIILCPVGWSIFLDEIYEENDLLVYSSLNAFLFDTNEL